MQGFLSACVIFLDNRVRLPNFPSTIKLGTGMLWHQMKGILSLQSARDVQQSKNFWKVLDSGFSLKVNECSRPSVHVMHWTQEFSFCLNTSQRHGKLLNRQKFSTRNDTFLCIWECSFLAECWPLTLWSKGRVLTSVTSRYQPSFEATIQLMNCVWFIVYFVVIHSLDYCKVTQDGQLLTSLRFIWKLTKLCRVGSCVAHCTPLEKCTHNLQQAWPLPSWTDHARLVVRVSARKNLIGCGAAGPQF